MTMLDFYDRKLVKCQKDIKETEFFIDSLHFGYKNGLIKSKKIYKHYLEMYTIKKRTLEHEMDDYYSQMIKLNKIVSQNTGDARIGGVV